LLHGHDVGLEVTFHRLTDLPNLRKKRSIDWQEMLYIPKR
jgi:hypothetical protein